MAKIVMSFLAISLLVGLSGCFATPQERAARQAERNQQQASSDRQRCRGYGFKSGTNAYSKCLMDIGSERRQMRQVNKIIECAKIDANARLLLAISGCL